MTTKNNIMEYPQKHLLPILIEGHISIYYQLILRFVSIFSIFAYVQYANDIVLGNVLT